MKPFLFPSCSFDHPLITFSPFHFLNYHCRDNTCPQCRESFASRRNCKPDPIFDQLLKSIFGANTTTADDAFLKPPSEALAAAKTIGTDLELLREAQRLSIAMKAGNGSAGQQDYGQGMGMAINKIHVDASAAALPAGAAAAGGGGDPKNGLKAQQQHYDGNNETSNTKNLQLKDKAKYKRPASAPAPGVGNGGSDGMTKKIKKKKPSQPDSAAGISTAPREDTDQGNQNLKDSINKDNMTPTKTNLDAPVTATNLAAAATTAAAAAPHYRSPSKGPGTPSKKYFGVRKYYPMGPGTQPWYLAYSQEGGNSASTTHYIKLGQFSSEEEAARIHDLHNLRSKGINPKKLSSTGSSLNFPYLSTIYVRLLAHGIAPGATPGEYEGASSKISTAVHGVGAPPGWHPPLKKNENRALSNKGGGGGGGGSRPSSASMGSKGVGGVNKGGAGMHKNKKQKSTPATTSAAAPTGVMQNHQGGYIADHNQNTTKLTPNHGDTQGAGAIFEAKVNVAALRAYELASRFSSSNMLGPLSGRPTAVVIELKPADGLALSKTWKMDWLTCPGDTLISEIATVIAERINKGETVSKNKSSNSDGHRGGDGGAVVVKTEEMDVDAPDSVSASSIYLNAVNELDASADFMSVYKEIEGSGGLLALTPTMQIRDLILLLADCGEDLVLEYVIQ